MRERIHVGDQTFINGVDEEFGAVRQITKDRLVVYVENSGEFVIPLDAVAKVLQQKVMFDRDKLEPQLLEAIAHAHDAEEPDA